MAEVKKCALRYLCSKVVYANQKGKKYNHYKGIVQQDNKYWYCNTVNKKKGCDSQSSLHLRRTRST